MNEKRRRIMKNRKLIKICLYLLFSVFACVCIYCVNFGLSWVNNLSYENMLLITLPFAGFAICFLVAFGLLADNISETRERELRKRKRYKSLKKTLQNSNNIIYLYKVPKFDLFKEAC